MAKSRCFFAIISFSDHLPQPAERQTDHLVHRPRPALRGGVRGRRRESDHLPLSSTKIDRAKRTTPSVAGVGVHARTGGRIPLSGARMLPSSESGHTTGHRAARAEQHGITYAAPVPAAVRADSLHSIAPGFGPTAADSTPPSWGAGAPAPPVRDGT